ncbi:hypothetical protein BV898_15349 [Hypsibius exemplaris]|uniref:Uncharacterized protein n=1 Tax=Hypsibius exemplaris TaxID=2072580 RepID=A0A9X6NBE2_HYPEX|nr:hypothetical protein BV898_15349 [Hypsibius exemplaris]
MDVADQIFLLKLHHSNSTLHKLCYLLHFFVLYHQLSTSNTMKFLSLFLLSVCLLAAISIGTAYGWTHNVPCDVDCGRSIAEQDQCCRAHGFSGGHCHGGSWSWCQ